MNFSSLLLPLIIVLFAVPLFLGTRKQKRAVAAQQEMQNALSFGDRVMTTSGLYATVVSTSPDSIDLEIAPGVTTTWLRAAVREKVADTTPDLVDSDEEYEESDEETATEAHDAAAHDGVEHAEHHDAEHHDSVPTTESGAEVASLEESSKKSH